ncbi:MAG TPA: hypothetical protein VLU43_16305 [Anaeromyxobacteraceae bacterium]|nr:hypothetical protein [Anaeromyxobacteraceae bacterium]
MLRRFVLSVAALAVIALAGNAQAQAKGGAAASDGKAKIGFGVGIETSLAGQPSSVSAVLTGTAPVPVMFYMPIQLTPQFRVEPQIGLFAASSDTGDASAFALGGGFFLTQPLAQNLDVYVGPRLILDFVGGKDKTVNPNASGSAVDVSILAAAGAEYYLSSHFSVGAEGQFGYSSQGSISAIGRPSASLWATNALIFLRAYL